MKYHIGNYAQHAKYWDWGGHDRTPEHEYWRVYAEKYGKQVLIPMCALGETGAYLARHGFSVTAFDLTPEMIEEGKKRFGNVEGLTLFKGDVCDFHFDIPPADFAFSMDFGHLQKMEYVKKALSCIHAHLRKGGGFVLETNLHLPGGRSYDTPIQTYEPLAQMYPGLRVWKTSYNRIDAQLGRHYILQTFYIQDEQGHTESFPHEFYLQNYPRQDWLDAFEAAGFEVRGEYTDRALKNWNSGGESFRIFELIKK